jgi:hypothetical protein
LIIDEIAKIHKVRHSGEACAGLDPVAGVHIHLKRLDSGACPGPRSGVRRNDGPSRFQIFYKTIIIPFPKKSLTKITHHHMVLLVF